MESSYVGRWWDPEPYDRALDADIVRRVLREQFSELAEGSIQFHRWGWECDAYRVDECWLFRFPRHAETANIGVMKSEVRALERVAAAIGNAFRVPRVSLWGVPGAHFHITSAVVSSSPASRRMIRARRGHRSSPTISRARSPRFIRFHPRRTSGSRPPP